MKNKIINKTLCLSGMLLLTAVCSIELNNNLLDRQKFLGTYAPTLKKLENNIDNQETSLFTETKGMKSNDGKYMLITTGIKLPLDELSNYKAVGYELTINSEKQEDHSSSYYYTAISVNTGLEENPTFTYTIESIFTNEENVSAMIVDEIDYLKENSYTFKAFLLDNKNNKIYAEEKQKAASYTLTLGDGYKFADGSTSKEVLEASTLPEINNEAGKEIAGWYTKDEKYIYDINSFTMPKENITIYPFFNPIHGTSLVPCSGSKKTPYLPDYFGNLSATDEEKKSEEYLAKFVDENLGYKDAIIDNIKGAELSTKVGLKDQDYFRMLTSVGTNGIVANKNYRFNFKFENRGNEAITFETIQVQSGVKVDAIDGSVTTGNITLQPNEIKDVSIEINLTKKNSNIMTVVAMHSEVNNLKLGVAIAKEEVIDVSKKYNLTIESNNVTFKNGEKTIQLSSGESIPEVISNVTDRTIVGWTDETNIYETNFVMGENDITIKPIFSSKNGFTNLKLGSGQGTGKPNKSNTSNLSIDKFNNIASSQTLVNGGENGYLENGYLISYSDAMALNSAFRVDTIVSSSAVVILGKNHQFAYNFENKGTTDIHWLS